MLNITYILVYSYNISICVSKFQQPYNSTTEPGLHIIMRYRVQVALIERFKYLQSQILGTLCPQCYFNSVTILRDFIKEATFS